MDREKVGICGSSAKMNEIMLFAGEWTELIRVLSETSQNQRQALCVFSHLWNLGNKRETGKMESVPDMDGRGERI